MQRALGLGSQLRAAARGPRGAAGTPGGCRAAGPPGVGVLLGLLVLGRRDFLAGLAAVADPQLHVHAASLLGDQPVVRWAGGARGLSHGLGPVHGSPTPARGAGAGAGEAARASSSGAAPGPWIDGS